MRDEEFTAIYRKLGQRLYNYIRWVTGNAPSCDDILQTVLIKAWHHDGGPRDEREREKWLFTVAINACRDYFRSESRYTRLCDRFGREWQDFDEPEESPRIWELLKELHDSDRSILYLHIKAGYSYAEIGSVLSMTEGQVRIRAFRALKQLRGLLSKEDV